MGAEPPPDFYVTRPGSWSASEAERFERLFTQQVAERTPGGEIDYTLDIAPWKFLCWLAEEKHLLLHGSNLPGLRVLEPRRPGDPSEFGGRCAVFGSSDGVWAMFYAVLDRSIATSMINGCFSQRGDGADRFFYFFSIDRETHESGAWQDGTVYVLRRQDFEREAPADGADPETEHQWASAGPVVPLTSLRVQPHDFPLIDDVRAHDVAAVRARAERDPDGFPWLDETD